MPLYEDRKNAENRICVSKETSRSLLFSTEKVIDAMAEQIRSNGMPCRVAVEMYYGIDAHRIGDMLVKKLMDLPVSVTWASSLFQSKEEIAEYKECFLTDDPSFGWANREGKLNEIMNKKKLDDLKKTLAQGQGIHLVVGPGALADGLETSFDLIYYAEKTRQPMLWQMWDGELVPFGADEPSKDYSWKEYYYCDYYLLNERKKKSITFMNYYIDGNDMENLKMVPRTGYDEILATLVQYPVKEIKIFQPGPWGAYRYRDLFKVPGLECNAWNELAGPELGVMVDVGREDTLTMPFVSVLKHADQFMGKYLAETYPDLFPLDIWLDDGYFEKPEPAERISMPIHNHPSTTYVKRHFNEPIGRYETYYIAEAYEGANTWMGYEEDADLEEWEDKCRASENLTPIENWKDYICNWPSNVGDLYLIPPGTTHGHGGNQMVLEMDTCPSIAGTEYSFFTYDFARNSWDDSTKTMTGKPCKMQLEHSFDNDKFRRKQWVKDHLLARPRVVKWTKDYQMDRYASLPEMPFEIERFQFSDHADNDTEGKFLHILTLTVGKRARIVSKTNPDRYTEIDLFQSCVVPASFGEYEIQSLGNGFSTVVQLRWKKG